MQTLDLNAAAKLLKLHPQTVLERQDPVISLRQNLASAGYLSKKTCLNGCAVTTIPLGI